MPVHTTITTHKKNSMPSMVDASMEKPLKNLPNKAEKIRPMIAVAIPIKMDLMIFILSFSLWDVDWFDDSRVSIDFMDLTGEREF